MLSIFIKAIALRNHQLGKQLQVAKINKSLEEFIAGTIKIAVGIAAILTIIMFFFMTAFSGSVSLVILLITFVVSYTLSYFYFKKVPLVYIKKRRTDIDKEVLFAGRFLLVKIESGVPLLNSIEDASLSYGIASNYFREILNDIKTGMPIEEAIERARDLSPSKYFKMILSEMLTSLKTGVDVSDTLRSILSQISKEQLMDIKEYAKKLNAFMMLFMMLAAVLPSLGMTIFIIIASFIKLDFNLVLVYTLLFMYAVMQFFFLSALKTIRPNMDF